MIRIKSQTAFHQYDQEGREITTWDAKRCAWIVNKAYENERIDWYGMDSDFPQGMTVEEYNELYPDFESNPNIEVTWRYDSIESLVKSFGDRAYWEENVTKYPYYVVRSWNYISKTDIPDIKSVTKYGGGLHKFGNKERGANAITITYNGNTQSMLKKEGKWQLC